MANILGISIGTRNIGIAVMKQRRLTDFRIRTFPGRWTEAKCENIFSVVEAVIKRHAITDITIKIPKPSHCSGNIDQLIRGIKELARWFHIETHPCTIQDIMKSYGISKKGDKTIIVSALVEKYPELKRDWKGKRAGAYNAKLYEAVACAERALRAGH